MTNLESWTPETPFLETPSFTPEQAAFSVTPEAEQAPPMWAEIQSPFARDKFETAAAHSGEAQMVAELLGELEDHEFDTAIYEMAGSMREAMAQHTGLNQELGEAETQRTFEQMFGPLVAESERMYDQMGQGLSQYDLSTATQGELEGLMAQFAPRPLVALPPEQENFLGGLFRKAASVVGKVVDFAKRGGQMIGKGLASIGKRFILPLLEKLKNLIRPLLKRVLQFAMNKLPASVRPIAQLLSRRLFGEGEMPVMEASQAPLAASASPVVVQMEYDLQLAQAVLAGPQSENETGQGEAPMSGENEDPFQRLYEAQAQLVDRLSQMEKGQDPAPAIQQFLPAVILALRPIISTVVSIIGRQKIVDFLARPLANLVQRWIGQEAAGVLAPPVVDIGLKLLGFETDQEPSDRRRQAAEIIAQTLHETVLNLAQQSEAAFETPNLAQALVAEAFEQAAAANFPPGVMRADLREVELENYAQQPPRWVLMPENGRRKYYKRWSIPQQITLGGAMLRALKGFNDEPLSQWAEQVLLRKTNENIKVKVHMYEIMLGSRLADIAAREKNVAGLGTYRFESWSNLHPLTVANAGILGAAGLGRDMAEVFQRGPYLVAPGQRFFYIEYSVPAGGYGRRNNIGIIINLLRGAITVKMRLSEATAQEVATYLRRGDIATPIQILRKAAGGLGAAVRSRRIGVRVVGEVGTLNEYLDEVGQLENFSAADILSRGVSAFSSAGGAALGMAQKAMGGLSPAILGSLGQSAGASGGSMGTGAAVAGASGGPAAAIGEMILEKIIDKLVDLLWSAIAQYFRNKSAEFIKAADDPAQGVTLLIAFEGMSSLQQFRDVREGRWAKGALGFITERIKNAIIPVTALPFPSIAIRPGSV